MAFRRAVVKLAAPTGKNISPHMAMWWKNYHKVNGEIIQMISPYEQHIVRPLFEDLPKKLARRFKDAFRDSWFPLLAAIWLVDHLKAENKRMHFEHRH